MKTTNATSIHRDRFYDADACNDNIFEAITSTIESFGGRRWFITGMQLSFVGPKDYTTSAGVDLCNRLQAHLGYIDFSFSLSATDTTGLSTVTVTMEHCDMSTYAHTETQQ